MAAHPEKTTTPDAPCDGHYSRIRVEWRGTIFSWKMDAGIRCRLWVERKKLRGEQMRAIALELESLAASLRRNSFPRKCVECGVVGKPMSGAYCIDCHNFLD